MCDDIHPAKKAAVGRKAPAKVAGAFFDDEQDDDGDAASEEEELLYAYAKQNQYLTTVLTRRPAFRQPTLSSSSTILSGEWQVGSTTEW